MSYSLSFCLEVENDAISCYVWYEEKAKGLGDEFLRIFYASATGILHTPFLYRKVHKDFRRYLMRRFPYAIYFRIEEQQVKVYGLFHCARGPAILKRKLWSRQ